MRKTNIFITLAILATLAVFSSCQKEELAGGSFSATMEKYGDKDSKVVYDSISRKFSWQVGDTISVYRHKNSTYSASTSRGRYRAAEINDSYAIFNYLTSSSNPDVTSSDFNGAYYAFSPQGIFRTLSLSKSGSEYNLSTLRVKLPATQLTDEGGNLIRFPMFAESEKDDQHLYFKNLCGLMRLSLQKDNTTIYAISVTTDQAINGDFTVTNQKTAPVLTQYGSSVTEAQKTVRLNLGAAQSINSKRDFYIALPAGEYPTLVIKIYSTDGNVCTLTKQSTKALQIARNKYTRVDLTNTTLNFTLPVDGAKGGVFSVADNKRVLFSKGNLLYNPSNDVWKFADHQYDTISYVRYQYYNDIYTNSYTGWLNLFRWGTSGYNDKGPYYNSENASDYGNGSNPITGDNANYDWGVYNQISNGGNETGLWRTLTKDEWTYLLQTRANAAQRYAFAKVNNINGLILLPDTWNAPSGISITFGTDFTNNQYTLVQWQQLEGAGAIFLPQTGNLTNQFKAANLTTGYYWTATNMSNYQAYPISFTCGTSSSLGLTSVSSRHYFYAVRLVHDN